MSAQHIAARSTVSRRRVRGTGRGMILMLVVLVGCGGDTTREDVCGAYNGLSAEVSGPHPFSDNVVFRKARALSNQASRYKDSAVVMAEADDLRRIGESNSTSLGELSDATTAIAGLCGHTLALATGNASNTDRRSSQPAEADVAAIKSTMDRYANATRDKDYQTVCNDLYAKDLVDRVRAAGLPCEVALRTGLEDRQNPRLQVLAVEVNGDQALARVRSTAVGEPTSTDLVRLIKEDGGWRVASLSEPGATLQTP